ncbi:MAG: transcription antitermination factor NusB [Dehalococcoidaceae bacterium]|nr:transcription antitermination factor NusB [Dehalococcoidaceae bacterium]
MVSSRRKARGAALQALYEIDISGHGRDEVIAGALGAAQLSFENEGFVKKLVDGILDKKGELDGYISRFAPAWPLAQLAVIDRNVLRIAMYELLYIGQTPVKVVINEAVELAKSFGSENSPKFVNGVLSSFNSSILDSGQTSLEG